MEVIKGRMYDYNNGRFLSVDPIIHGGSQGINPYTYIFNNPLSGIDPTGYAPDLFLQSFLTDRVGHEMAREIVSAGKPTISDETAAVLAVGVLSAILVVVEIADVADTVSDVNLVKKGLKKLIIGDGIKNTLKGVKQALKSGIEKIKSSVSKNKNISSIQSPTKNSAVKAGDEGTYGNLIDHKKNNGEVELLDMDHQPSFASQVKSAEQQLNRPLTKKELSLLKKNTPAVASPRKIHQQTSPTYGGRNNKGKINADAANPDAAKARDRKVLEEALKKRAKEKKNAS